MSCRALHTAPYYIEYRLALRYEVQERLEGNRSAAASDQGQDLHT